MTLITIIMPCFNAENTISDSIKSVLLQNYSNWELIIVDDKSTDNTSEVVHSFNDERIKYICLSLNSGSPATPRNVGLDNAKGEYISFLDSDDSWDYNKLDLQLSFMMKNNYSFTCTGYSITDINNNLLSTYMPPPSVSYKDLLINNSIGCLTCMIHKDLIGEFRFPKCGHEDYSLWLTLSKNVDKVYSLQHYLAYYKKGQDTVSSNKWKLLRFYWNIYMNIEKLGYSKSLYYCFRYFINVVWFKYK